MRLCGPQLCSSLPQISPMTTIEVMCSFNFLEASHDRLCQRVSGLLRSWKEQGWRREFGGGLTWSGTKRK